MHYWPREVAVSTEGQSAKPRYAVVTVTYNPELQALRRQLKAVAAAGCVVLVDNASDEHTRTALRHLAVEFVAATLIFNDANLGLAAGLNAGAREALRQFPDCEYLVFLDQDTEPEDGGVEQLVRATAKLRAINPRVGQVGPLMVDAETGISYGIHVIRAWRWTRVYPRPGGNEPLPCAGVHGSGSVVPVDVFRALGGFDESLFIYHVDSEWSFRVAGAGYRLYTIPAVRFKHRMGTGTIRYWLGGWRLWPYGTPARHYYLFRNVITLMRRGYVPKVWKFWAVAKLMLMALVHASADRQRVQQVRAMYAGIRAGLRGEGGAWRG